jgi:hypothetical protein
MTKRKASGAGKKKTPAKLVRKNKSVPLSGPKDAVKRSSSKAVAASAKARTAAAKPVETQVLAETQVERSLSIFDAQMHLFQSMLRFSPLGYFMRAQEMAREATAKLQDRS